MEKKRRDIESLSTVPLYMDQNSFYEDAYNRGETPWTGEGKPAAPLLSAVKKIRKGLRLRRALDLGSGEGRNSDFLRKAGFKVIGVEYQWKALQKAIGIGAKNLLYVRGDIFRIPLKPASFDVVVDYGVFHHMRRKDTGVYLTLLRELLAPGGYYLLSCFEKNFRHGNGKIYKRGYVMHKKHYDRFSSSGELRRIFGKYMEILEMTKDKAGFLNCVMKVAESAHK